MGKKRYQQFIYRKIIILATIGLVALFGNTFGKKKPHEDPKKSCINSQCHSEEVKHTFLHGPLAVKQCFSCHAPIPVLPGEDKHKFKILDSIPVLCFICHKDVNLKEDFHEPIAKGECLKCHDPHGSELKSQLRLPSSKELCVECHDKVVTKPYTHGPIEKGDCLACHLSHGKNKMLLHQNATGQKGCINCHKPISGVLLRRSDVIIHKPVKEDCKECHRIHDSDFKALLKDDTPDICLGCHEKEKAEINDENYQNRALCEESRCRNCHYNHYSTNEKLLRKKDILLCFSCHEEMQKVSKNLPHKHEPLKKGNCKSCHKAHSSKNYRLLIRALQPGLYIPYHDSAYSICFECHEPKIVKDQFSKEATNFRNGDRNLHFVHVNKAKKGRTCRTCHSSHFASNKQLIKSEIPFGDWKIPIKFKKTKNGGSCQTGCHKEQFYDRNALVQKSDSTAKQLSDQPGN